MAKVLIIDEDASLNRTLTMVFKRLGHHTGYCYLYESHSRRSGVAGRGCKSHDYRTDHEHLTLTRSPTTRSSGDLEGVAHIAAHHVAEAIQYRGLDRNSLFP